MTITIENPTAEALFAAFQRLPLSEAERFKQLIDAAKAESAAEEETAWREASARSAARFFDDEERA